jgi:2-polyprenyl-3-methyl-5-hydroxy-6-metoxy-1,4-benzoquinol methylase
LEDGKPTRYVQCIGCSTIYASPRSSHASRYAWLDERFSLGENAFQNAQARKPALERIATILQRYLSGGALLDIGCDLGNLFEYFRKPEWKTYGVELSPSAAEYASNTYGAKVHSGFVSQAKFPDVFFDLVTMLDMFYHVEDPRADLKEVARILKPGGYLAIEISGQAYFMFRSIGIVSWLIDRQWSRLDTNSVYLFFFSPAGLRKLVEESGLNIKATHIINSPVTSNPVRNLISGTHGLLIRFLSKFSPRWINWSPKYLLVAQKGDA